MNDTLAEIERKHLAMLLERSGEERLKMGCSMHATAQALVRASVLENNPPGIARRPAAGPLPPLLRPRIRRRHATEDPPCPGRGEAVESLEDPAAYVAAGQGRRLPPSSVQHFIVTFTEPFALRRRGVFAPSRRVERPVTSTGSVRSLTRLERLSRRACPEVSRKTVSKGEPYLDL